MLDVALVGNISISDAYTQFESDIEAARFWNENFRLLEKNYFSNFEFSEEETADLTWLIIVGSCIVSVFLVVLLAYVVMTCFGRKLGGLNSHNRVDVADEFWLDSRNIEEANWNHYHTEYQDSKQLGW